MVQRVFYEIKYEDQIFLSWLNNDSILTTIGLCEQTFNLFLSRVEAKKINSFSKCDKLFL